jgi:hypothetical protein
MAYLLGALARKFQLSVGSLVRLLDERMHDHHTLADEKTVERATDAGLPARPELEETFAKRPRMGETKIRAVFDQEFHQTGIVRKDINGPRLDLSKDALVEILDLVAHGRRLAKMRTLRNA